MAGLCSAAAGAATGYASPRTDANVAPSSPVRASQWIAGMKDTSENFEQNDFEQNDSDVLAFEVCDATLEAAASALPGAAFSFPNSPTVSVIFQCCGND